MNKRSTAETFVPQDAQLPPFGQVLETSFLSEPDGEAFRHQGQSLSRSRLFSDARTVAAELRGAGLRPGEPVIVDLPHGLALAVAMVAVPLAGGCAVPLDMAAPPQRRDAIKADVNARLSLSHSGPGEHIPTIHKAEPSAAGQGFDPALLFLVYTSGSTGGPKGVEVSNTNYVARMAHIVPAERPEDPGVDLCWTPASFIGMLDEFFFPLLCNKPSVIASPDIRVDPVSFVALVKSEQVTSFRITPSLLEVLLGAGLGPQFGSVSDIYCSGEAVAASLITAVQNQTSARLWCFYGASEAPGIAYLQFDQDSPTPARLAYTPQPFVAFRMTEASGEICVSGDVISSGYWNRDKLNDETFFTADGTRWYRTGDLGQLRPDGRLEILGRVDLSDRKINGARVSLEEVRSAITSVPGVENAWVSVIEPDRPGQQVRLVGHAKATSDAFPGSEAALNKLAEMLPSPARPVALMRHDAFPLTLNGKIDVQALLSMARGHLDQESQRHGRSVDAGHEVKPKFLKPVIALAEELLDTNQLNGTENFFRAGGNSLAAVQLAMLLSERFGCELQSGAIFNADSLMDIARGIQDDDHQVTSSLRLLRKGTSTSRRIFTVNSTGNYVNLANCLSPEINIHNLSIFGLTKALGDRLECYELEEIAERFANELIDICPEGPWPLVAYCQDGCLAVETARVLKRRTGVAAQLLLIDTFFIDHRMTLIMRARSLLDLGPRQTAMKLMRRLSKGRSCSKRAGGTAPKPSHQPEPSNKAQCDKRLMARFREHYMSYAPAPLDAPVTLFISREWRHVNLRSVHQMAQTNLSIREIEGEHNTLFSDAHISEFGSALDAELDALFAG